MESLGVLLLDEGLDGSEEVGHRHPGEDEGGRRTDPAPSHTERPGCGHGQQGPGECGERHRVDEAEHVPEFGDDRDGGSQTGASGDPEQVGVSQGIPEHSLIGSARTGQEGADEKP